MAKSRTDLGAAFFLYKKLDRTQKICYPKIVVILQFVEEVLL